MPGGDGTGPDGMGRMSGRRFGYCAGYGVPGYENVIRGGGFRGGAGGRARGRFGHRHCFQATGMTGRQRSRKRWADESLVSRGMVGPDFSREEELVDLRKQAAYLEQSLRDINERISAITSPSE